MQVAIYENRFEKIRFFKDKSMSFVAWLSHMCVPSLKSSGEYIFNEGDEIGVIYFALTGDIQFVLPRFENVGYIKIEDGDVFGIVDIFVSMEDLGKDHENESWFANKAALTR